MLEHFIERVPETGCWIFMGALNRNGYGRVWRKNRTTLVHRFLYEHYIGPIPDGLVHDHRCRVRCCGNPWHQEPVTVKVNTHRGNAKLFTRLTN